MQIIGNLKYHPEKESVIIAKYGKLLGKHKHFFTEKTHMVKRPENLKNQTKN